MLLSPLYPSAIANPTFSITIHNASWDYEGLEPRHGTRVTSLAEKPYYDPKSPTRRQALGLLGPSEIEELEKYAN